MLKQRSLDRCDVCLGDVMTVYLLCVAAMMTRTVCVYIFGAVGKQCINLCKYFSIQRWLSKDGSHVYLHGTQHTAYLVTHIFNSIQPDKTVNKKELESFLLQ